MKNLSIILSIVFLSILFFSCKNDKPKISESSVKSETETEIVNVSNNSKHATDVFWGDTHLHTSNSFDVYLFGTPNATLQSAYRFAMGDEVISPTTGQKMQINQPLDFLVIADHAEAVGSVPRLFKNDTTFTNTRIGKILLEVGGNKTDEELAKVYDLISLAGSNEPNDYNLTPIDFYKDMHAGEKRRDTWTENCETADEFNNPGKFTALIGWEWTSQTNGANLHRVIFTDSDAKASSQFLPYSMLESDDPEKLWQWLDETNTNTGVDFVAIPHNPNISRGMMFPLKTNSGKPIDINYANTRTKWEPVVEATQIKGDSETHPVFSPNDEFADFETYQFIIIPNGGTPEPTEGDYLRSGLKRGLELQKNIGVNPYKVGMIGSTDSHTGMSAVEENNFAGKGQHDATKEQRPHPTGLGDAKGWDMAAAGYAAVWATENTREAIFEAFKRKETYSSTGPRIKLRFFGGYEFTDEDLHANNMAEIGYNKGVPMGSDLAQSDSNVPKFMVHALKDPNDANLDRVQIVKGWVDANGFSHEKVYDVALSNNRTDGSIAVGNTVDLKTGNYTNTIGEVELSTLWTDPDFDASQNAFYYVRVLQIPTPRYSLLNSIKMGIDWKKSGRPATIQERAYSSPIWYNAK